MINRIKNLIKKLKEAMEKSDILFNPSVREIQKLLSESQSHIVRFVALPDGKFYIADADEWVHDSMIKEMGIIRSENYLCGEIYKDGYTWMYKYMLFGYLGIVNPDRVFKDRKELTRLFETTRFYQNVKPLVREVDFE